MNEHAHTSRLRCAVYTRKSSEEGLEQSFNSLDAQREAGLDYIKSQKHQGWVAVSSSYDDGGFSGGSMNRPALQRLLADIAAGRIDVVVVYKVDRLSRSLADFARLMQDFDARGVSFVSVTQQFNTTTSMGRLTLNMLLSFAQFEREVAGERIRDKIAATMKRGVWIAGSPPLGYRRIDREKGRGIEVVPDEAKVVLEIFKGYLELGSLVKLSQRMAKLGRTSKKWTARNGRVHGGFRFTTGGLYKILTNPVYIGKITHTRRLRGAGAGAGAGGEALTSVYDGVHEPIVPRELWDKVDAMMQRAKREARTRWTHSHLLKGKVRTIDGAAMSPSSVHKKRDWKGRPKSQTTRVGYYVSQKAVKEGYAACPVKSVNAGHLDGVVRGLVLDHLASMGLHTAFDDPSTCDAKIREMIRGVVVGPDRLTVELDAARLAEMKGAEASSKEAVSKRGCPGRAPARACVFSPTVKSDEQRVVLTLAIQIKKLDGRRLLLGPDGQDLLATGGVAGAPEPNPAIVRSIGLAHAALRGIVDDRCSVTEVARRLGVPVATVKHLLPLTQLGPVVLRAALEGTLPPRTSIKRLLAVARELDWQRQAALLSRR